MSPNSLSSFLTYAKTLVQNLPTPEIGITNRLMAIIILTPAETAKNLKPVMTRAPQKLIPKGSPLDISPAKNGWEPSIREIFQTQHTPHLSYQHSRHCRLWLYQQFSMLYHPIHQQFLHLKRHSCWPTKRIIDPSVPHRRFTFSSSTFWRPSVEYLPFLGRT